MSPVPSCIFCAIVAGRAACWRLFEDDNTLAFMDIHLVIPKAHRPTLLDIPPAEFAAVARTLVRISRAGLANAPARRAQSGSGERPSRGAIGHAPACARAAAARRRSAADQLVANQSRRFGPHCGACRTNPPALVSGYDNWILDRSRYS
jgi:hypothetical protein